MTKWAVTQNAGSNAFVASRAEDTSTKMGIMHAIYGVGATCAPLVSTHFARLRAGPLYTWSTSAWPLPTPSARR